jgi:hypothetical protein
VAVIKLSTPEPSSLSEWFERDHNLSTKDAEDQSRKMISFFSALAASHASSQPTTAASLSA